MNQLNSVAQSNNYNQEKNLISINDVKDSRKNLNVDIIEKVNDNEINSHNTDINDNS